MSQSNSLDTGRREFESGDFETTVGRRDSWITIRGRGGHLMMSVEEVADVIAVLNCARDYIEDGRNAVPGEAGAADSTDPAVDARTRPGLSTTDLLADPSVTAAVPPES